MIEHDCDIDACMEALDLLEQAAEKLKSNENDLLEEVRAAIEKIDAHLQNG